MDCRGFPPFKANVTFVPIQFFTLVVPYRSRGCVRIVGYILRQLLGWVDREGNPRCERLRVTYRDFISDAGVSRGALSEAVQEAIEFHLIRCVSPSRPGCKGESAESAVYELCWDHEGPYTDSPEEFRGFYFPAAAFIIHQKNGRPEKCPKVARKNIPNAFFDFLLPREQLSVIRTVGALLFYSIQWGPGGERRVPVSRSITELARLTHMSRQHTHAAVCLAIEHGYIELSKPGIFDPRAGIDSQPATYKIRWAEPDATAIEELNQGDVAVSKPYATHDSFKKVNGAVVQKSERNQSNKVNGEQSRMVNGMSVKKDPKISQTAATGAHSDPCVQDQGAAADFDMARDLLIRTGFDTQVAGHLAQHFSLEVIRRQVDWLPLRKATKNRLGLLRLAIEQDWPKPAPCNSTADPALAAAEQFARFYYAGYHGNGAEPTVDPFPGDASAAKQFVQQLPGYQSESPLVAEWGRRFGRFVRGKQNGDSNAKAYLRTALTLYADEFLRLAHRGFRNQRHAALQEAKERHQKEFLSAYHEYLRQTETRLRDASPAAYGRFEERRAQERDCMARTLSNPAKVLVGWETEQCRLDAFAEFFAKHPEYPVLDFWRWDAQLNPGRLQIVEADML